MNADESAGMLLVLLVSLGIGLIIFLICREILCWYFKTSKIESKINEIEGQLIGIKKLLRNNAPSGQKMENQK